MGYLGGSHAASMAARSVDGYGPCRPFFGMCGSCAKTFPGCEKKFKPRRSAEDLKHLVRCNPGIDLGILKESPPKADGSRAVALAGPGRSPGEQRW